MLQLDSLLGATVQETLYSETSKRIVHHRNGGKDKVVRIQGRPILSNNAVSRSLLQGVSQKDKN